MIRLIRSSLILTATALLSACGSGGEANGASVTTATTSADRTAFERPDDHAIGNPDAAVTLIEFASVSCAACANWHNTVYPEFKKKYIDTGKVRYVFREFLAGEPTMADAGFRIALCAPEDKYFENIGLQFERQAQLFEFARRNQLREAYINLAKASGLSEEEFIECMSNDAIRDDYMERMQTGRDLGVTGTPNFVVNGELQPNLFTLKSIEDVILPLLGETAEADTPANEAVDDDETAPETTE